MFHPTKSDEYPPTIHCQSTPKPTRPLVCRAREGGSHPSSAGDQWVGAPAWRCASKEGPALLLRSKDSPPRRERDSRERSAPETTNRIAYTLVEIWVCTTFSAICATVAIVVEPPRGRFMARRFESARQSRAQHFQGRGHTPKLQLPFPEVL